MKSPFLGIILIVIGVVALAHNLGYINFSLTYLLRTWWPVVLIALGISYLITGNKRP